MDKKQTGNKLYYLHVKLANRNILFLDSELMVTSEYKIRESLETWDTNLHCFTHMDDLLLEILERNNISLSENPKELCDVYLATKRHPEVKLPILYNEIPRPMDKDETLDKLSEEKVNRAARKYGECAKLWDHVYRKRYRDADTSYDQENIMYGYFPLALADSYRHRRDLTIVLHAIEKKYQDYLDFIQVDYRVPLAEQYRLHRNSPKIKLTRTEPNVSLQELKRLRELNKLMPDAELFAFLDENPEYREEHGFDLDNDQNSSLRR